MTAIAPLEFSYRDKKLGDTQAVSVVTAPDVFHPTSTTVLLLRAARRAGVRVVSARGAERCRAGRHALDPRRARAGPELSRTGRPARVPGVDVVPRVGGARAGTRPFRGRRAGGRAVVPAR